MYKNLLRKGQCACTNTSHLIETLGGIQTVKAQHGELDQDGNGKLVIKILLSKDINLLYLEL